MINFSISSKRYIIDIYKEYYFYTYYMNNNYMMKRNEFNIRILSPLKFWLFFSYVMGFIRQFFCLLYDPININPLMQCFILLIFKIHFSILINYSLSHQLQRNHLLVRNYKYLFIHYDQTLYMLSIPF